MTPDNDISRRDALKQLSAIGAGAVLSGQVMPAEFFGAQGDIVVAGRPVEIAVASLSPVTARITVMPIVDGRAVPVPAVGALVNDRFDAFGAQIVRDRRRVAVERVDALDLVVRYTADPPTIHIDTRAGAPVQKLTLSATTADVSFLLGSGPLLGLGEGGPQFDRKGNVDTMRNGQGGFRLATHGTRAPIQWLIGTADGWGLFIHQPYGAFDLTGAEGKFTPNAPGGRGGGRGDGRAAGAADAPPPAPPAPPATPPAAPLDVFIVASRDPSVIMREYARITGLPEMPPMWAFGYQQSSRTLGGAEEILSVARTMREKQLPCDTLIYLGTEFAPSGWNTRNGEFTWHPTNFPNPREMMTQLHARNFKVVVHVVIEGQQLTGTVNDPCTAPPLPPGRTPDNRWPPNRQASCYWPVHKELMDVGVDGFWPDQGDGFDGPSRLNRHRMYLEGPQLYRPNERPFALHRNASAGAQRYGGFIWSGDVQSRWETLATHVSIAINTGLSGLPYWGTDIGGFNPTVEYTAELHTRWFQFGAFCPSFRAHGRNWHLKLPWGWNGGDGGPFEAGQWRASPEDLRNAQVEPICKKFLELRSRLTPYLQTAVREAHDTGLPIMRALWLHYPDDAAAVARGDEYLWGRDLLVAPVVEQGATTRSVYLPRGGWYDFWTEEPNSAPAGRVVPKAVDLSTMPIYVRAGAIIPMGPVKQYAGEPVDGPLSLTVYPGADGAYTLYEDDGHTLEHKRGAFTRIEIVWRNQDRRFTMRLATGSRMLPAGRKQVEVRVAGSSAARRFEFNGSEVAVTL